LLTSLSDAAAPERSVFFGEVSLSGAVRPVARIEQRLKESARLGFAHAYVPEGSPSSVDGLTITPIKRLIQLVELLAPDALNA
jgi:DNA repair protein RadA/Sms